MAIYHQALRSGGLPNWLYCPATKGGIAVPIGQSTIDGASLWNDPNHLRPGVGRVNLVAVGYRTGVTGLPGGIVGPVPNIDLRGKKFFVDIEITNLQRQGKGAVGLWIQGFFPDIKLGGKYLNLFQKNDLICTQFGLLHPNNNPNAFTGTSATQRKQISIPFSQNPNHWVSMGSAIARSDVYDDWQNPTADLGRMLLPNVWVDLGIIVIEPKDETGAPHFTGSIIIHEIRLEDI